MTEEQGGRNRIWIRLDTGFGEDPEVALMSAIPRLVLIHLMCTSKRLDYHGRVKAKFLDAGYLTRACGVTDSEGGQDAVAKAVETIIASGILTRTPEDPNLYQFRSWRKWNKAPSDAPEKVAERVARHRRNGRKTYPSDAPEKVKERKARWKARSLVPVTTNGLVPVTTGTSGTSGTSRSGSRSKPAQPRENTQQNATRSCNDEKRYRERVKAPYGSNQSYSCTSPEKSSIKGTGGAGGAAPDSAPNTHGEAAPKPGAERPLSFSISSRQETPEERDRRMRAETDELVRLAKMDLERARRPRRRQP